MLRRNKDIFLLNHRNKNFKMDSQDYETNRNLTLMFFLEKLLVEKGSNSDAVNPQTRSLHDLSCQFGTRGFSKEMRQIAGGSQAGLRKFLLQYPSLFTINGEQVSITQSSRLCGSGSVGDGSNGQDGEDVGGRNYNKEAIEYFKNRLRAYGPGTEVPIKSLLGHRSQAPPEVRHISGKRILMIDTNISVCNIGALNLYMSNICNDLFQGNMQKNLKIFLRNFRRSLLSRKMKKSYT